MSALTAVRDEVYLRIGVKKAANGFVFANDFVLEKTWKPWETLEDIADRTKFPHGKVYVLGGRRGDLIVRGRQPNNAAGPREYGVQLGFQIVPNDIDDDDEIDTYDAFLDELEDICRKEFNLAPYSFSRLEYAMTPEGQPLDFIMQRKALTYEAYFAAYYLRVLA